MSASVSNSVFLESMFADALPGMYAMLCSFAGDPYKADRAAWASRPWAPGQKLPHWFGNGNSYVAVSTFEPDPQTAEIRRRKALFSALQALLFDDVGTKVGWSKLLRQPSAIIETSPENFQAFYFLVQDALARDRGVCERLIQAMIKTGLTSSGADPGQAGVTRFGRLPNGINGKQKYTERLGRPFRTRCTLFEPDRRHTISEIAAAWRLDLSEPQPAYANAISITPALIRSATERFSALIETFRLMNMYGGQRGVWHDITCPWIHAHTDRADSGSAIAEPSADNNYAGGFQCHHGHCEHRTMRDVRAWLLALVAELDNARTQ